MPALLPVYSMILTLIDIIAPVFLVIGAGYLAVSRKWFGVSMVDGLMKFAIQFAVPCLLFRATSSMDLGSAFDWRPMLAFYAGSTTTFTLATLLAWRQFGRRPGEAVAVGFGALFSNLVLIGLPISERAWGAENLEPAYAIVSIHAPYCYLLGITTMELLRADGRSMRETAGVVISSMFRNSLMIGIGARFPRQSQWACSPGFRIVSRRYVGACGFASGVIRSWRRADALFIQGRAW